MPKAYRRNPGQERARKDLLTRGKRFNLIYGGSRSGKTFELLGTVIERALLAPNSRHLAVRQEGTSAKRALVKGTWPEVMRLRFPGVTYEWKEQYGYFILPNGSEVWVGGLNDDKALEKILGNEYATIYINEASEVKYVAWTLLRSRLAQSVKTITGKPLSQRMYVDLNPTTRQHWTYRLWIDGVEPESQTPVDMGQYGHIVVNPMDNAENLSDEYLTDLRNLPPRARKRFLDGTYIEDLEDALWRRANFKRVQNCPPLTRIVVGVDPAVTLEAGSDETGIIAAGVDVHGNGYVLDDASAKLRPEDWARQAISLFTLHKADRVVAEVNQGGDMVEHTIRAVMHDVPYRGVRAVRNKIIRAEPVAALYERGKIYHVGEFPQLEDQMCSFTTGFDRKAAGYSPDRVDALVWAFTDLFPSLALPADDDDDWHDETDHTRNEATGY
jgi:predicted phage terminase large subunit-like protein